MRASARRAPAQARWYCPQGHRTFSLLPDRLAARFPGTLSEIEQVVAAVEDASTLEACAHQLRPDPIRLPGALRWVRRRLTVVRTLLAPTENFSVGLNRLTLSIENT